MSEVIHIENLCRAKQQDTLLERNNRVIYERVDRFMNKALDDHNKKALELVTDPDDAA